MADFLSVPSRRTMGRDYLRTSTPGVPQPGGAADVRTKELLSQGGERLAEAGRSVLGFLTGPRGEGMVPYQGPERAPAPQRRADEEAAARAALSAQDQARAPGAAPPDQGASYRPERTGTVESNPGEAGRYGWLTVHSQPGGDPATRAGGFAHPATGRADAASGFTAKPLPPDDAAMLYGPEAAGGGHVWTRRSPGAQEAQYERARYGGDVLARQAEESAGLEASRADTAASRAGIARSRALEEQPFAPEQAKIAAEVGGERAKAQPEQGRAELALQFFSSYQDALTRIEAAEAAGQLDPNTAAEARRRARDEYVLGLSGFVPGFRIPKEDPLSGLVAAAPEE